MRRWERVEKRKKERRSAVEKDVDLIKRLVCTSGYIRDVSCLNAKILTHPDLVHVAYRAIRR